jgi:hypothetical protein
MEKTERRNNQHHPKANRRPRNHPPPKHFYAHTSSLPTLPAWMPVLLYFSWSFCEAKTPKLKNDMEVIF